MSKVPVPREIELAFQLRDAGRIGEAIHAFREALACHPTHAKGWLALGGLHRQRQEYDLAVTCFRRAVELRQKIELCSLGLFHSLLNAGRIEEAVAEAARFLDKVEEGATCTDETKHMYAGWVRDATKLGRAWERRRN